MTYMYPTSEVGTTVHVHMLCEHTIPVGRAGAEAGKSTNMRRAIAVCVHTYWITDSINAHNTLLHDTLTLAI